MRDFPNSRVRLLWDFLSPEPTLTLITLKSTFIHRNYLQSQEGHLAIGLVV